MGDGNIGSQQRWEESCEPSQKQGRMGRLGNKEYCQLYRMSEGNKEEAGCTLAKVGSDETMF